MDLDDIELKATRKRLENREIKVGEYVRTKKGYIAKVTSGIVYLELDRPVDFKKDSGCYYSGQDLLDDTNIIKKHSQKIIDLIEVGDYVNGKKIEAIIDDGWKVAGVTERVLCFETDFPIEKGLRAYYNCDIKSIVTHEQFAQIEYKVEE